MSRILFILIFSVVPLMATSDPNALTVHLLNYIASDYSGAVSSKNSVLDSFEYEEQLEFSQKILNQIRANKDLNKTSFEAEAVQLQKMVFEKAHPEKVKKLAEQMAEQLVQRTGISTKPEHSIDLVSGKKLYEQNCYQCHGAEGHGDGPSSGNFDPRPGNFASNKLQGKGPFHFYNVIKMGVPGTAMASFDYLTSEEIWNLSFYVSELQKGNRSTLSPENQSFLLKAHQALELCLSAFQNKEWDKARSFAISAYLDGIEPLEPKLNLKDPEFKAKLERALMDIRRRVDNGSSEREFASLVTGTQNLLDQAGVLIAHDNPSLWFTFSVSFGIFLREAFEAALLLITLLGVVRTFGNRSAVLAVHGGWGLAVALGLTAWFVSGWVLVLTGAQRELLEGGVSLFAVFILLYFGIWMHRKSEIGRWRNFMKEMVTLAKERKNILILGGIAFIGVFREVFETIVFLRALLLEAGGNHQMALALGVLSAFILVLVLSWLSVKLSARLPVRQLFMVSSWIMFFLSFVLLGKGIHALQETGLIPVTELGLGIRWDVVGLYPFYQTLGAQFALVLLLVVIKYWDSRALVGQARESLS
ncbi:hypothetical protein EBT16_04345 [bacterium]|nr:hypothetical protein [bacterium]